MASEIGVDHPITGLATLYAIMRTAIGKAVKVSDGSLVTYVEANRAQYAIALTEQVAGACYYVGDVPAGVAEGVYSVTGYKRAGGAPAGGDSPVGGESRFDWDGSAVISLASIGDSIGGGAWVVTITVNDGADPLENALVRMTMGANTRTVRTNASGVAVFNLDSGTWTVIITLSGYTFTSTTLAVSANTPHTYSMTSVVFTPSDPGETTAYIYAYDEDGIVVAGIMFQCKLASLEISAVSGSSRIVEAISDVNGLVQFPGRLPGATYVFRRGDDVPWAEVTIPADAGATFPIYVRRGIIGLE